MEWSRSRRRVVGLRSRRRGCRLDAPSRSAFEPRATSAAEPAYGRPADEAGHAGQLSRPLARWVGRRFTRRRGPAAGGRFGGRVRSQCPSVQPNDGHHVEPMHRPRTRRQPCSQTTATTSNRCTHYAPAANRAAKRRSRRRTDALTTHPPPTVQPNDAHHVDAPARVRRASRRRVSARRPPRRRRRGGG